MMWQTGLKRWRSPSRSSRPRELVPKPSGEAGGLVNPKRLQRQMGRPILYHRTLVSAEGRAEERAHWLTQNNLLIILTKKQGAAGITTAAPRIAGQWGRGDNRLPELRTGPKVVPASDKYF